MPYHNEPDEAVLKRGEVQAGRMARAARRLLAEVTEACGAGEATVWLISPDGMQMEGTLNCGKTPHILESVSVPVTDSVVGMVASSGLATSIGPDDPHNLTVDQKTGLPVKAMIVAPIYVYGKICGALSAINPVSQGADTGAGERLFPAAALEVLQWKAFLIGLVLTAHADAP